MRVHLKKGRDGRDTLACHRDDGTATWAPLHPSMAVHDLTHYVVETELGLTGAFFGLVAGGWALEDFADKVRRAAMPPAALAVEVIVGQLDLERLPASHLPFAEFAEALRLALSGHGLEMPDGVTEDWLDRVRTRRAELVAVWARVEPGDSLDLTFP